MKYEQIKEEIKTIAEISSTVPERFRERCFELLLQHLLHSTSNNGNGGDKNPPAATSRSTDENQDSTGTTNGSIPTPSQIKVFMQRTGITISELEKVMIFEDGIVHLVREPAGTRIARGQIEWALLIALINGIENNTLAADPEKVRSVCQEKGFYDGTNFGKNFKSTNAAKLFQGVMEGQGTAQKLTPTGQDELAKLIKSLAATPA